MFENTENKRKRGQVGPFLKIFEYLFSLRVGNEVGDDKPPAEFLVVLDIDDRFAAVWIRNLPRDGATESGIILAVELSKYVWLKILKPWSSLVEGDDQPD